MTVQLQRTALACATGVMLLATAVLQAAPATSEELNGQTATTESSAGGEWRNPTGASLPAGTGVPQSRTVELLLQLQDNPQALSAQTSTTSQNSRTTGAGTRPGTPVAADGSASSPAMLEEEANLRERLKAAMLESASPRPATSESREDGARGTGSSTLSSSGNSSYSIGSSRSSEPRESLLSNPVIRFIRENRVLVVMTSLGILLAIWGTANFSMRRSR
jgi:hypothetical protein